LVIRKITTANKLIEAVPKGQPLFSPFFAAGTTVGHRWKTISPQRIAITASACNQQGKQG